MAGSLRTHVEQDMTKHTLEHIHIKLSGMLGSRTTFVIVEGSDDLAFYNKFLDNSRTSSYYSTKLDDEGNVIDGGCEELQNIVKTVLEEEQTDKILGIMDSDYRKYIDDYVYPHNIFHTDHRDMEMTALSTLAVQQALKGWIPDFENRIQGVLPILRHAGILRILNDKYKLGCSFRKKVKISSTFNTNKQTLFGHWRIRYDYNFLKACLKRRKQSFVGFLHSIAGLSKATAHYLSHSYAQENDFDICQGHDTLQLLSLCLVKTSKYNPNTIWEKCFDAYTKDDFRQTRLCSDIRAWERAMGAKVVLL